MSPPSLIQPTAVWRACRAGSSWCRRARAARPPNDTWPSRIDRRSPPSQPEVGGPSNASTAERSSAVGRASLRWRSTGEGESVAGGHGRVADAGSIRTAHALNSAVPDFGSVASMVRRLTRTSS